MNLCTLTPTLFELSLVYPIANKVVNFYAINLPIFAIFYEFLDK